MPSYKQRILHSNMHVGIQQWFTYSRRRLLWKGLTLGALVLILFGLFRTWQELPRDEINITPIYIAIAAGIYVITYVMHLFGWHAIATLTFGEIPLKDNIEAVAASDLVKYLPTVAWYIANRVHYYEQKQIPKRSVIAASFLEMIILLGSGSIILLACWFYSNPSWMILIGVTISSIIIIKIVRSKIANWWQKNILLHEMPHERQFFYWAISVFFYALSWFVGAIFLMAILQIFTSVSVDYYWPLLNIWLIAGLTGTVISLTLGTIGVAREATLTFLLAQIWPFSIGVAAAVVVKLLLTIGQISCALLILAYLNLIERIKK